MTCDYSAGTVLAPSPSERCIITVSSQRPNLKPTDHGDHLPVAARLAFDDQPLQQLQANTAAVAVRP
jgi:hypothetical protein